MLGEPRRDPLDLVNVASSGKTLAMRGFLRRLVGGCYVGELLLDRLAAEVERRIIEHPIEQALGPRWIAVFEPAERQGSHPGWLLPVGHHRRECVGRQRVARPIDGPLDAAAEPVAAGRRGIR